MTNKVKKHRVEFYDPNGKFLRYEVFNSKEQALRFTEYGTKVLTSVSLKYAGTMEVNMVCAECSKTIDAEEKHINQDNNTFYCMDCIDEIKVIEYVTKSGNFLGTDHEIVIENEN